MKLLPTIRTWALGQDRLWLMFAKVGRCHETTLRNTASARYPHIREFTRNPHYSPT